MEQILKTVLRVQVEKKKETRLLEETKAAVNVKII